MVGSEEEDRRVQKSDQSHCRREITAEGRERGRGALLAKLCDQSSPFLKFSC